jgi:hypothetical protein
MKSKLARALRKWADLIDPRVNPTDATTIHINIDARDAIKEVELVEQAVRRAVAATNDLKRRVPVGYVRSAVTGQVQRQEWPAKAE